MFRGDKSRGNFSLWESPNTILQGTALGCAEANGRKYKADEEVPRRVFGSVNTRAIVSGKVPRHAFDEANTKSISSKHVVHATAATEAEVRGSIRGRETWAKIARGGSYDGAGNDPSRMQGNQYRELVEAGYCSGESSRPRSDVVYESRHDIVPRTCGECINVIIALHALFSMQPMLCCPHIYAIGLSNKHLYAVDITSLSF